jgi:hypothetical protein
MQNVAKETPRRRRYMRGPDKWRRECTIKTLHMVHEVLGPRLDACKTEAECWLITREFAGEIGLDPSGAIKAGRDGSWNTMLHVIKKWLWEFGII